MAVEGWTKTWTFFEDKWHEGNVPIMGPRTHAAWLCSVVFDGARAFEGVTPDLDLHCARVNESARKLFLKPIVSTERWIDLAHEGISRFDKSACLYIRPMYWAEHESPWIQSHLPDSTRWCLSIYEAPMREPKGFSTTLSPYRRPTLDTMPVDAKAGCLYPNNARALFEAQSRGFDNAIVCDMLGNVAELATSNIFMTTKKEGKDVVFTPSANGTFLAGITRQRVIGLLKDVNISVIEKTLTYRDFEAAEEIFSTGNYSKIVPVTRIGDRALPFGDVYKKARSLYWEFAHSRKVSPINTEALHSAP
ncbi:MAG: branched-chain amino acid aminotransferase [Acidobacteria bacterium]|nr:MAG: branched-chain amino acid aminotransferase [Acidobacteriota bacterium]PYY19826.1 MAG: branched-chain amino acid aminotransferase [Acidobacteriota bacterium]